MAILYLREIGIVLFVLYASVIFIGALLSWKKARQNSIELGRRDIYTYSMVFFFLLIAFGLIFRIYFLFFLAKTPEEFLIQITATERSAESLPTYAADGRLEMLHLLWQIQLGFTTAGITCLLFGTEYQIIKRTKYALTIIELILTPLVIILPYELAHTVYYLTFIPPFVWIFLYSMVAKQTAGAIRRNAILFLIGFVIFFIGAGLNSESARSIIFGLLGMEVTESSAIFACWISPITMIIGFIFMLYGILRKI